MNLKKSALFPSHREQVKLTLCQTQSPKSEARGRGSEPRERPWRGRRQAGVRVPLRSPCWPWPCGSSVLLGSQLLPNAFSGSTSPGIPHPPCSGVCDPSSSRGAAPRWKLQLVSPGTPGAGAGDAGTSYPGLRSPALHPVLAHSAEHKPRPPPARHSGGHVVKGESKSPTGSSPPVAEGPGLPFRSCAGVGGAQWSLSGGRHRDNRNALVMLAAFPDRPTGREPRAGTGPGEGLQPGVQAQRMPH